MLISHSKKFIFIHVYKVAGTSVNQAMGRYCLYSSSVRNPITKLKIALGVYPEIFVKDFPGHITAAELKKRIDAKIFNGYFKFAFVRNPWDWQVSLYHYALQDKTHHQHELTKAFGSFERYLEWRVQDDLRLQKDFVMDDQNNLLVDYIGKMENLQNDFDVICNRIGVPKKTLPHANRSSRGNYEKYYTPRTRDMIKEYFREDIEAFGYSF